jgi:TolA-binding protein
VKVTSGEKVVFQDLMQAASSKTLGPEDNFTITLGKPKNASVYIDNRLVYGEGRGYPATLTFSLPGDIDLSAIKPSTSQSTSGDAESPADEQPGPSASVSQPEGSPPASYIGWIETGMWALLKEDYDTAIQDFKRAYEIAPNYAQVNMLLGKAYRGTGDLDKSVEYLNTALRLKSDDPDSLLEMGYTQEAKGNKDAAIEYFEKYLAINDREDIREHLEELRNE